MELDPEYRPMFESLVIQGRLLGCSCEPEYLSLAEVAERNATPEQLERVRQQEVEAAGAPGGYIWHADSCVIHRRTWAKYN